MSGAKRSKGRVIIADPAGLRLLDIYGWGFPWIQVDDRIMDYLKERIRDGGEVRLEDSGAPAEEISKFVEFTKKRGGNDEEA